MRRTCSTAVAIGVSCAIFFFLFIAVGCGSSSSNAKIRLINAAPIGANVDMLIDSKSVANDIAYGSASSYASVNAGSRHLQLEPTGSNSAFSDVTITVKGSTDTSVVAASGPASGEFSVTDNNTAPSAGNISLRIINASPFLGTCDAYIVTAGSSINSQTPTYTSVANASASGYTTLAAGTYQVFFTVPGSKTIVVSTSSLSFSSGQIRTIMVLDGQNGGVTTSVVSDLN
jgi:uncharacterized protein DUF4397